MRLCYDVDAQWAYKMYSVNVNGCFISQHLCIALDIHKLRGFSYNAFFVYPKIELNEEMFASIRQAGNVIPIVEKQNH